MNRASDSVERAIDAALGPALDAHHARAATTPCLRLAVALSGGRDSTTLLHALANARARHAIELSAIHVHHGLSPNADAWVEFCRQQCAALAVQLTIERVEVQARGGDSLEDAARKVRMQALLEHDVDAIALAHHADDQAETLLLQLLRGAGTHGLAAMARARMHVCGRTLLRPLLALPASVIATYAQEHDLRWIEDESNADVRFRRNALRHRVVPTLRELFAGYPGTLVRAASHQAEAAGLLDDLAELDASTIGVRDPVFGLCLDHAALIVLTRDKPARARNLLRWFIRAHGMPAASTARLDELLQQCLRARPDSKTSLRHADAALSLHDGRLVVHDVPHAEPMDLPWRGERVVRCPAGVLNAQMTRGGGISAALASSGRFHLRSRAGGERMRVAPHERPVAVSRLLGSRRTPLWQRNQWPLLWAGDVVAAVPGLAIDPRYAAAPGDDGYLLQWQPSGTAEGSSETR